MINMNVEELKLKFLLNKILGFGFTKGPLNLNRCCVKLWLILQRTKQRTIVIT
jgi:hypothetical protein